MAVLYLAALCIVLVGSSEAQAQRQCDDDASFDTFDSSVTALEALLAENARGRAPDAASTDKLLKDLVRLSQCEGRLGRRVLFYRAQLYGLRGELVEEEHAVQRLRERDLGPEEVKELNALYPPTVPPDRGPAADSRASETSRVRREDDLFDFDAEPEDFEEEEEQDDRRTNTRRRRPRRDSRDAEVPSVDSSLRTNTRRRRPRRDSSDAEMPSVNSILETQIEVSGADAFEHHETRYVQWRVTMPNGAVAKFQGWASADDRTCSKLDAGALGVFWSGVDEGQAWAYDRRNGAKLRSGPLADKLRLEADFDRASDPKRFLSTELLGTARFHGKRAWRVRAELTDRVRKSYFFDQATGHLLGEEETVSKDGEKRKRRTVYSRYAEVDDGLAVAREVLLSTDGEETLMRLEEFEWDVTDMPDPPQEARYLLRHRRR